MKKIFLLLLFFMGIIGVNAQDIELSSGLCFDADVSCTYGEEYKIVVPSGTFSFCPSIVKLIIFSSITFPPIIFYFSLIEQAINFLLL